MSAQPQPLFRPPPEPRAGRSAPAAHARAGSPHYSRFVSMMKLILPSMAVVLIALVVVWPRLSSVDERFRLGFSSMSAGAVDSLTMVNARYFGTDNDNQPFTVTADLATEAADGSHALDMESPKADITLKDGTWLVLDSSTGHYNHDSGLLDLRGGVNVFQDQGYELHTAAVQVDLKANRAVGRDPVRGQGPFGEVDAEGLLITERGKNVTFTGKSKLILRPAAGAKP
ncbi:MAG: LPS export ABC transporter periplasmic protein LptC [Alphaproteobacteria bacterium]|nr:LPS export ABC transporter periplasmic protein LptC [Alphaproteobacteria bacterium]MBF0129553.1 LPS export ABC transporter periplasmic protein LptC [Alphaproteobacteria bacterium]